MAAPLAVIGGVSAADVVLPRITLAPLLVSGPMLAGLMLPPRRVVLVGLLASLLVLPLGIADHISGSTGQVWIAAGIIGASCVAVALSRRRRSPWGTPLPRIRVRAARPRDRKEQQLDHVLARGRRSGMVGDILYRLLLGRPASDAEQAELRRRSQEGIPLMDLAHALKGSAEGSRVTVHGVVPALRTYVRPRFDAGTGQSVLPRLVFLHFMKVGGISLSDLFAGWFDVEEARIGLFVDDLALTPPPMLATLRLIAGHIPFAALALIPPPFKTLAVLRDPLSRTVSHYSTLKKSDSAFHDLTLERFVFDDTFEALSGNYQARQLVHDIDLAGAWRSYSPEHLVAASGGDPFVDYPLAALFDSGRMDASDDELLRHAASNLGRIDLVGTTDDLDGVARRVAEVFGRRPEPVNRLNVSDQIDRADLSDRIRRRIEDRSAIDRELYLLARGRARSE